MAKPISNDLRGRVIAAISSGMSRRAAAARFDVSAASAIRWQALAQKQGDARPKPMGGDRRSKPLEEKAATILALVEARPDATMEELRSALAESGVCTSYGALWRFLDRHEITRKKRPRTPPSRSAPT